MNAIRLVLSAGLLALLAERGPAWPPLAQQAKIQRDRLAYVLKDPDQFNRAVFLAAQLPPNEVEKFRKFQAERRRAAEEARRKKEAADRKAAEDRKKPENIEAAAQRKLDLAKILAADGKTDKAVSRYREIIKDFPKTKAAEEAKRLLKKVGK